MSRQPALPHILITGFGPFPGAPANPSAALARALARLRRNALDDTRRTLRILPTQWAEAAGFPHALDEPAPDIVLMIGLAARRRQVTIERIGRNRTRLSPDAARRRPTALLLAPGGPASFDCAADPVHLLHTLRRAGVPAGLSRDAGGYVCNALSYSAYGWTRAAGRARPRLAVFVHIPRPRRGGPLAFDRLTRALGDLLVALVSQFRAASAR